MSSGRRDYWRAVALVTSGTGVAQMIPLLGSLVIARLFVPAEVGVFMVWLGLAALAGVFVTGRFEMALALEPDGPQRAAAASATFLTSVLLVICVSFVGAVTWPFVVRQLPTVPTTLIWLFMPTVAALASAQIWQAWAATEGRFRALAMMRITQAAAITSFQIGAGFLAPSAVSLALAHVAGVLAGVAMITWQLPLRCLPEGRKSLYRFWSRYRRFPIYSLPADTVNAAAGQLPLMILAARYGVDVAGFVALAFRTLGAPISLLGSAVLDVFKRRASESWRATGSCRGPFLETFMVLAAGSIIATLIFWYAGEGLFVLAFGPEWRESGTAAIILLPLFALRFVVSPLSYTFYIAEKQHLDLIWQICLLAMTLTTLTCVEGYERTLMAYTLGYCSLYVIYALLSYRFSAGKNA
jgi:O-antigen/teichoic acid export membrane protein